MDEERIAEAVRRVLAENGWPSAPDAKGKPSPAAAPAGARQGEEASPPNGMTLHLAELLAARIEEEAKARHMRVVTAIADEGGCLRLLRSMDGAYIGSVDVAVNKAYTCVAFQMSTAELSRLAAPGGPLYGIQHTNGGRIVIFGGGEPLAAEGRIIGALGVSGGSAEEDTALAAYGASILKEVISCL